MRLQLLLPALFAFSMLPSLASGAIVITEIVDGNRIAADGSAGSGSDPFLAFFELTNTGGTSASLDGLHFINFNNGNNSASFGSTALSGTLGAGETFYVAYEANNPGSTAFNTTYGFEANIYMGSKFINGDDAIVLLNTEYVADSGALNTATVVDAYGVVGTDGTGEAWEYMDTFAFRNPSIVDANPNFTASEWTFGAVNAFDGQDAAFHKANTSVFTAVPEPSSLALLAVAGVAGFVRRRR